MHAIERLLYVHEPARTKGFYAARLDAPPSLGMPRLTEFDLSGVTLGRMPGVDTATLMPDGDLVAARRCELSGRRPDAALGRIAHAGGELLSGLWLRTWRETVSDAIDPDGHGVAVTALEAELTRDPS